LWIGLLGLLLATLACDLTPGALLPAAETATATPTQFVRPKTILPAVAPDLSVTAPPKATATTRPAAMNTPAATPSPTADAPPTPPAAANPTSTPTRVAATAKPPTPRPSPDPNWITIREEDISKAIASGAGTEQGLKVQDLQVRFADGKMTVTADELALGPVQVKQLVMVGRLLAQNGQLRFESESVSPRGLVTSLLPALANQALTQYASQWYIEEVRTRDGRLELRIR
jgi:hypothetical protein